MLSKYPGVKGSYTLPYMGHIPYPINTFRVGYIGGLLQQGIQLRYTHDQFAVDHTDAIHCGTQGQLVVGQTVDVLVEDIAGTLLGDVET